MRFTMLGFSLPYSLCPSIKDRESEHKHCSYYGSAEALALGGIMDVNTSLG